MKPKLLQILLGALASTLTVLVSHWANVPPELATVAALASGPFATASAGDAFAQIWTL